jgi:hypothetical protein
MSRTPPPPLPNRPNLLDCFLLLVGPALSLCLCRVPLFDVKPNGTITDPMILSFLPMLPTLLRLTEGLLLLWPLFYAGQRILGRTQGLTAVEWLWVFAWLGVATVNGLANWNQWVSVPDALQPYKDYLFYWPQLLWYVLVVPSLALVALLIGLLGLFGRESPPWTHLFGLALLVWPVLPLAAILALAKFA